MTSVDWAGSEGFQQKAAVDGTIAFGVQEALITSADSTLHTKHDHRYSVSGRSFKFRACVPTWTGLQS